MEKAREEARAKRLVRSSTSHPNATRRVTGLGHGRGFTISLLPLTFCPGCQWCSMVCYYRTRWRERAWGPWPSTASTHPIPHRGESSGPMATSHRVAWHGHALPPSLPTPRSSVVVSHIVCEEGGFARAGHKASRPIEEGRKAGRSAGIADR